MPEIIKTNEGVHIIDTRDSADKRKKQKRLAGQEALEQNQLSTQDQEFDKLV